MEQFIGFLLEIRQWRVEQWHRRGKNNEYRNVVLGHIEVQRDLWMLLMFDIKVARIFSHRIITCFRCGFFLPFEAIWQPYDADLFCIQFWADQCWHIIKPRQIQCRLSSTTKFKIALLTAESNNGEKNRPKMLANRFFFVPSQPCFQFI